jgi:catalase
MSPVEQDHIVGAFSFELAKVTRVEIRERVLNTMLANIDPDLTRAVADYLGMPAPIAKNGKAPKPRGKVLVSPLLSLLNPATGVQGDITGRKVAILVAAGSSAADVATMKKALTGAGAMGLVLAAKLGNVEGADGSIPVDHTLDTMPALVFDATYVPGGADAVAALVASADARLFVAETYQHAKPIACHSDAAPLLEAIGAPMPPGTEAGIVVGTGSALAKAFIVAMGMHRAWGRPTLGAPGAPPARELAVAAPATKATKRG